MKISVDEIQLGEVIGSGTVGEVYRGHMKATGEEVAVKFLKRSISEDQLVRARFRREMTILERLQHPNIIRYHGGGEQDGRLFYAMEVIDGGNVRELMDRFGAMSWQEVASIARQVCSGLQHAHNHGIIHRDLKPSNLFLTMAAQVKLGDFGIARDTNTADITSQGLTVGTHAYMAPEQIKGQDDVTGKADLYSLGCVLFEMLTGHKPFHGTNFALLFEQHLFQKPPKVSEFVTDCPAELVRLVDQLLQKDPEQRPFNARSVQGEMIRMLAESVESGPLMKSPLPSDAIGGAGGGKDVGAGTVVDPGLRLLARKLGPPDTRQVSWQALTIIGLVAVVVVCLAAIFSGNT